MSDSKINRAGWDRLSARYQADHGEQLARGKVWGVWAIPEDEIGVLGEVADKDVLELGCGAAMWSIHLAQDGARMVGLDNSGEQLAAARALQEEHGVSFPLVHAPADEVPLPDASFDIVFCDHGAFSFADARLVVPEVSRLLRPGGLLAFNAATALFVMCWDEGTGQPGDRLVAPWFDFDRYVDPDGGIVSHTASHSAWIRLFRENGLFVEDLIELIAPENAKTTYNSFATSTWASKWPAEEIWRVRKPG